MSSQQRIAHIYNPAQQSAQALINGFVVRQDTFADVFQSLQQQHIADQPRHFIIEGQRGMGKTTLLLRLYHEVKRDETLHPWLVPIIFKEEEYGITSLLDFWLSVIDYLAESYVIYEDLAQLSIPSQDLQQNETFVREMLFKRLESEGKKFVLFIDNFGDILNRWTSAELKQFQQILATTSNFRLVAGSSYSMEDFFQSTQRQTFYTKLFAKPSTQQASLFYQHFQLIQLKGLNEAESILLLRKLGEVYHDRKIGQILLNQAQRVEALRRLTGGVIRTIVLLYEIFVDQEDGNTFLDLELILDRVTPLYKHRMDDLPAQQQKIVHAIAMYWDAISTKEIAKQTMIPSKVISAQLRKLEKSGWVEKVKTGTKNHLYLLTERFFNIWYLMRMGRHIGRSRVRWLVSFFEAWCQNQDELGWRAKQHISAMGNQTYNPRAAYFISEALANVTFIDWELQDELLKKTKDFLDKTDQSLSHKLSKSSRELFAEARQLHRMNQPETALERLLRIQNKNDYVYELMGSLYHYHLRDHEKAKEAYIASMRASDREVNYWKKAADDMQQNANFQSQFLQQVLDLNRQKVRVTERKKGLTALSLAMLYVESLDQPQQAKELYPIILKIGTRNTIYFLADFFFRQRMEKDLAYEAIQLAVSKEPKPNYLSMKAKIEIWQGDINTSLTTAKEFLYQMDFIDEHNKLVQEYLMLLIAHGQYEFVIHYFQEEVPDAATWGKLRFKSVFRPLYYALLYFLKDDKMSEHLRMGGELQGTVNEVVTRIMELQKLYA